MKLCLYGLIAVCLAACSGMERVEREKIRKKNEITQPISRSSGEKKYVLKTPTHTPRAPYPWESEFNLPRITKEFFRCKGVFTNPLKSNEEDLSKPFIDCEGRHGLPVIGGKENIYPILIDLFSAR